MIILMMWIFFKNVLGSGAFGEVRKAIHRKTGLVRAIKIITKSKHTLEELSVMRNEVNILS